MRVIKLDEVDSTNSYSKKNLDILPDKTVVHALRQTDGRGRLNRKWVDFGQDNLFLSIVLKPADSFSSSYSNLTQYLSVCLCKVLETYGLSPKIKWPNDVLVNDKKIAGILSESVMHSNVLDGIILGIGVNLNADEKDFVLVKDRPVTSVNIEISNPVDMDVFFDKLMGEFFNNYDEFLACGFSFIKDEYLKRSCFLNKELEVLVFKDVKSGVVKEVNDNGELVLQTKNDELTLTIGDIL